MIKIQINNQTYDPSQAHPSWLNKTIHELQSQSIEICLKIFIKFDGVDIVLSCGDCPTGHGGSGRHPNEKEQELFDLWDKLGCKNKPVNAGSVVAFLKHVS